MTTPSGAMTTEKSDSSKKTDPAWKYAIQVEAGNRDKMQCNFCSKILCGGVYRMKEHWIGGRRNAEKSQSSWRLQKRDGRVCEKIYELLCGYIEKIGPSNVVQVVTDSASNNKLAGKLLGGQVSASILDTVCSSLHGVNFGRHI